MGSKAVVYRNLFFSLVGVITFCGTTLLAQSTNIAIGTTTVQPSVKRLGINLGTLTTYDSGQTTQNLLSGNPGFEGQILNSTIRCAYGTASSCTDEDQWAGWPAGYWSGATYEFFYGTAAGRKGTIASSTAPGFGQGVILNFADSGVVPSTGDYVIVRKNISGGATGGWSPYTYGSATITDNLTDLPPGTAGKQTVAVAAPTANDFANLSYYFDSTPGKTFVQLNGTYQLQFKAKGTGGLNQVYIQLARAGGVNFLNQLMPLTNGWSTYTLTFTGTENGSSLGTMALSFGTLGATAFELDDVSLTPLNSDPTNTTVLRDPVLSALRTLQPGILRFWGGQLGDTLDNLLAPQFGRQRAGYSAWYSPQADYGLHDFMVMCQAIGAEPWFVVPSTFSATDASNLIEYLAGASTTPYGAKRVALGQATPWTQVFPKIHLEFGNEAWNSTFKGGSIDYPAAYGSRAQTIFSAMRAYPAYVPVNFDLVLGGQSSSPGLNSEIQSNCNNNDTFDVAPYLMSTVNSYSDNESLYGSTFAEPEAFMSSTGTAEGVTPGPVYQTYQAIQSSSHPVPLSFYEINMGTVNGSITQSALNTYASSLGAGLSVVDTMLQGLKQFGIVNQTLFALPQYDFNRPDGSSVFLWGSVVDMGVTDRKRPQFLALQMANQAISNGAVMLQTVHTGADPTWSQPLVNSVQLDVAHDLQSYAFAQGTTLSAIIFNFSRSTALPVAFSGTNAPSGTVQMQQLTSANLTDTNETSSVININPSTLTNFNSASGLTLPPYSMTVLTWTGTQLPVVSAVAATGLTGTSAKITWTTDQATSSLVNLAPATPNSPSGVSGYSIATPLNTALQTSHSVTVSGLAPSTAYNYDVVSTNAAGNSVTSSNYVFTTPAQAPVISGVTSSNITGTSAVIGWTTDQPASSLVNYGTTTAYGSSLGLSSSLVTSHTVTLSGLAPGTTYNFLVLSANSAGTSASSANFTIKTLAQPPVITAVGTNSLAGSSATVTWNTDQPASSQVSYGTTTSYGSSSALNSALATAHSVTLTGLTAGITYDFAVVSANSAGNTATSPNATFTILPTSNAPNVGYVASWSITTSGATVSWSTDVAATTQLAYGTSPALGQLSPLQSSLGTSHGVTLTGLTPSTTYYFVAQSTGANGVTGSSTTYTFTTQAVSGKPSISSISATSGSGNQAQISWTTSVPTYSYVQYGPTTSYNRWSSQTALTANPSVTLGYVPSGLIHYQLVSTDSKGNQTLSADYTFVEP